MKTFARNYSIVRQLGAGGMGAVYEAEQLPSGRRVALKVITSALSQDPRILTRFEREARAATSITSEHIVQVLDVGRDEESGAPYLVMELLHGEDLEQLFTRLGPLATDAALRIGVQICKGLEMAHGLGIIHRDIKPANLFLSEGKDGERIIKVLDFGIAKIASAEAIGQKPLTRTGTLLGTPLYMSPEQALAKGPVDHRTDIWSVGIVLYQALAGRTPFEHANSLGDFIVAVCTTRATSVKRHAPWVSTEVAAVLDKALAIEPNDRFATMADLRQALLAFLPQNTTLQTSMLVRDPGAGEHLGPPNRGPLARGAAPETPPESKSLGTVPPVVSASPPLAPEPRAPSVVSRQDLVPPTIPGAPALSAMVVQGPAVAGPPASPPPPAPMPRRPAKHSTLPFAGLVLGGAAIGLGIAFAAGAFNRKSSEQEPVVTESSSRPTVVKADARSLASLAGSWWLENGAQLDALVVASSLQLRIHNPDQFPNQGYSAAEPYLVLHPVDGDMTSFHVEAHVRPTAPRGTTYEVTRAQASCHVTATEAAGKPLRGVEAIDRLVIQTVKVEPSASIFAREGTHIVRCTNLDEARIIPTEVVLSRTRPQAPIAAAAPNPGGTTSRDAGAHDAGAHGTTAKDAGVDAGTGTLDAGAKDAGGGEFGGRGAPCQDDSQCAPRRCVAHRCADRRDPRPSSSAKP